MVINTQDISINAPSTKIELLRRESRKQLNVEKKDIEVPSEFQWEGPIDFYGYTTCNTHSMATPLAQKKSPIDIEFMDSKCNSDEASNSEPELLE
ncbi:hypothetical protein AYI69_g7823 [Smittium culicis]|uniref:Uncharacterized protein n=1 Tax=Smittium culicis TaxID=133412 RepID=A0A1R1XPD6_9FUNG|nr:hypothetical protein AYI69_g9406 [Smittium culicis]OMJ16496.1 hypothetical protein AYI69_g7823 [Smittium culicis]